MNSLRTSRRTRSALIAALAALTICGIGLAGVVCNGGVNPTYSRVDNATPGGDVCEYSPHQQCYDCVSHAPQGPTWIHCAEDEGFHDFCEFYDTWQDIPPIPDYHLKNPVS